MVLPRPNQDKPKRILLSILSKAGDKSSNTRAVGSPHARERWTSAGVQWSDPAYKLTVEDCPVYCY